MDHSGKVHAKDKLEKRAEGSGGCLIAASDLSKR